MTAKDKLHEDIDALRVKVKSKEIDTQQTIACVQSLTDRYVEQTGKRPDVGALERMSTLILNEELSEVSRSKTANTEHPFLSERQKSRRYDRETSEVWSQEVGSDGEDYRPSTRDNNRKMRDVLGKQMRGSVRSRNKERRRKYREFTKRQPVHTYYIPVGRSDISSSHT